MRYLWAVFGLASLGFGLAGAVLPLLPTVPFLLLAAFCFDRSSPRLHNWLVSHVHFGPMIENWRTRGAISRQAKIAASVSILAAFLISVVLGVHPMVLAIQAVVLSAVSLFIWSRPEA